MQVDVQFSNDWPTKIRPVAIVKAASKFQLKRPVDYNYLTDDGWLLREVALFGCRSGLFHLVYGTSGCWCDFWDAQ